MILFWDRNDVKHMPRVFSGVVSARSGGLFVDSHAQYYLQGCMLQSKHKIRHSGLFKTMPTDATMLVVNA